MKYILNICNTDLERKHSQFPTSEADKFFWKTIPSLVVLHLNDMEIKMGLDAWTFVTLLHKRPKKQ